MRRTFKLLRPKPGRPPVAPGLPLGLPELCQPDPAGPSGARSVWWSADGDDDLWLELGTVALQTGYRVTVLGSPWRTVQREDGHRERIERPEVIGLTLARSAGRERAVLLRRSVLGDVEPEEAIHYGVSSAGQLGALLARGELGQYPVPRPVQMAATLCSWAGPMMVYRGSTPENYPARKWDQRRAYLGAWRQPMPQRGAGWTMREAPRWDATPILRGVRTGFMVAQIFQCGPYASWPAAVAGDRIRMPLAGRSVVAIPLYCAALLEAADLLAVERVIVDYIAPADPELGYRVAEHYDGFGKTVYQRTHAALTPCPRYSGRLHMDGRIDWSLQHPDPRTLRPDVASLLRSLVATKTAAFLASLPEHSACAAHIDAVYECSGLTAAEHSETSGLPVELATWTEDPDTAPAGSWLSHLEPVQGRFFAPGRWKFGGEHVCMGGSSVSGADPVFLRGRIWHGDPRDNEQAWSTARPAETGGWYDYAWPGVDVEGFHG